MKPDHAAKIRRAKDGDTIPCFGQHPGCLGTTTARPNEAKGKLCDNCKKLRWVQTCLTCTLVKPQPGEVVFTDIDAEQHQLENPDHQMLPAMLRSVG